MRWGGRSLVDAIFLRFSKFRAIALLVALASAFETLHSLPARSGGRIITRRKIV
jgi:hypothetical protein